MGDPEYDWCGGCHHLFPYGRQCPCREPASDRIERAAQELERDAAALRSLLRNRRAKPLSEGND